MTRPAFFSGVTSSKCSNDNYFLTDVVPQKLIQHHMNLENLPNPQRFPSRNWAFLPAALVLGPHHTPPICDAQKGWRFHSPRKNSRTWMGTDSFHSPFWCLNRYPTPSKRIRAVFCTQGSVAYQHSKIPPSCTRLDLSLENAGDGWWIGCHVYRKQVSTHCKYRAFWFSYQVVDSLSLGPRIKSSVIEVPIARSNLVCPQKWQN